MQNGTIKIGGGILILLLMHSVSMVLIAIALLRGL
jgi:hypothetical protein